MPARYLRASRHVLEASGRVALARGPILYCIEGADHPGLDLRDLSLPGRCAELRVEPSAALGNLPTLRGEALLDDPDHGPLYRQDRDEMPSPERPVELTAIPYFAWANRGSGRMQVWMRSRTR